MAAQCTATAKRSGKRCIRTPVRGAAVCYVHGGAAPQVQAAAARNLLAAEAAETVGKLRLRTGPVDNPLLALQLVAGELIDVKDWMRGHIEKLDAAQVGSTDDKGAEQILAQMQVYMKMLDSTVNALSQLGKLKIDERLAAIEEQTKLMIIRALQAGLASAGVTGPAAKKAMEVTARNLRVLVAAPNPRTGVYEVEQRERVRA
jgi:hypothetical protein